LIFGVLFITASVGPGVGIIAASYAGCDRTAVVSLITLGTALMGTFYPGMKVNALDLSPNYAGTLMAIVNGIGAFTGIITPYLVGVLTPDVSAFYILKGIICV
jgi:ACS family sodium-dependent inorganic phosphate cotransporter